MKIQARKILSLTIAVIILATCFCGCGKSAQDSKKIKIITTLFPQYDFAKNICGDKADVTLLLDPGVESHSFDPTPKDINNIMNCDLFIYTGAEMEPWVKTVLDSVGESVRVLDLSDGILEPKDDDNPHDADGHSHSADSHYWLDMKNAIKMVSSIYFAVNEIDGDNSAFYQQNAKTLESKLNSLDRDIKLAVSKSDKTIVFGGKFAYYYFVEAYSINYKTVYDTCTTSVEPSAKRVAEITDFVRQNSIKYVFHEELSDPKTARSIADACDCQLLQFHTAHNVSKEDFDKGVTFVELMTQNYNNLLKGLGQ